MDKLSRRLKWGCSTAALATSAALLASNAMAQTAVQSPTTIETVVVTGTSIRGTAPIGSDLVTENQQDIKDTGAQTIADLMVNVPAVTSMGAAGDNENHTSYYQPTIHQLGSSLSNGTLILIDSHRAPAGSTNHSVVDPNIIPTNMIQRVEVLADGSSSVYGSEAIAGVINFITRDSFEGVQAQAQQSFINGSAQTTASILVGTNTDKTGIMFSYEYMHNGALADIDRAWTNNNQTPFVPAAVLAAAAPGGASPNFNTFACDPAAIQPNGTGNVFTSATSGVSLAKTSANSPCNTWANGDLYQTEIRNDVMVKGRQELTSNLTFTTELVWATRQNTYITPSGTITATVFGTGAQANPFFQAPTGFVGTLKNESILWDSDALLGPGTGFATAQTMMAEGELEYRLGDNWVFNLLAFAGRDDSTSGTYNTLNAGVADLALNGTTNSGGSLTTVSVPGTTQIITELPLTATTSLDVWDPAATNKTSSTLIAQLKDSANTLEKIFSDQQFRASANGTVFDLPTGPVKVAVGGELLDSQLHQDQSAPNNTGPATTSAHDIVINGEHRGVKAVFGEIDVPVVSPDLNIPLVKALDVDISGRIDDYSDVGTTSNYKFAANWTVIDGLKVRANMSTSFVAPSLDIRGTVTQPGFYVGNTFTGVTNNISVPVSSFPLVTLEGIAGCTAASVTCNISSLQGIQNRDGDPNVKPAKGRSWSVGFDYVPNFINNLKVVFTLWHTEELGAMTGPNLNNVVDSASLNSLLTFTPSCASQAQISALEHGIPQTGALPACAQYLFNDPNSNYLNIKIEGIDAGFQYVYPTDEWGTFKVGDSITEFVSFNQAFGLQAQGIYYSVLNTTGANTAFPSVSTAMRANLGWSFEDFDANLFMNWTGAYRNWGTPINPITLDANGNPNGGGDHVSANVTFDAHFAYDFETNYTGADEISVNIRNIAAHRPPFYNSANGFDSWVANAFGRIIQVGLTAKY